MWIGRGSCSSNAGCALVTAKRLLQQRGERSFLRFQTFENPSRSPDGNSSGPLRPWDVMGSEVLCGRLSIHSTEVKHQNHVRANSSSALTEKSRKMAVTVLTKVFVFNGNERNWENLDHLHDREGNSSNFSAR